MKYQKRLGEIFVILSSILFGLMPLITSIIYSHGSNPLTAAAFRFLIGCVMILPISLYKSRGNLILSKAYHVKLIRIAVFYAITPVLLYLSYTCLPSGMASTLHFIYPVAVILILFFFYRERITQKQLFCCFLCLLGIILLEGEDGSFNMTGAVLAVLSGISYASYIVLMGRSGLKKLPFMTMAFWLNLYAGIINLLIALFSGNLDLDMDATGWAAQILLAFSCVVLAVLLFQKGLFLCGEVKASLLSTFEPLTGVVVGLALFGERMSVRVACGILLILISSILLVAPVKKLKRRKKEARF